MRHTKNMVSHLITVFRITQSCALLMSFPQAAAQHRQAVKDRKKQNQEKSAVVQKVRLGLLLEAVRSAVRLAGSACQLVELHAVMSHDAAVL
jgi:hypothetical protein